MFALFAFDMDRAMAMAADDEVKIPLQRADYVNQCMTAHIRLS